VVDEAVRSDKVATAFSASDGLAFFVVQMLHEVFSRVELAKAESATEGAFESSCLRDTVIQVLKREKFALLVHYVL